MNHIETRPSSFAEQKTGIPPIRPRHLIPGVGYIIFLRGIKPNPNQTQAQAKENWEQRERSMSFFVAYHVLASGFIALGTWTQFLQKIV